MIAKFSISENFWSIAAFMLALGCFCKYFNTLVFIITKIYVFPCNWVIFNYSNEFTQVVPCFLFAIQQAVSSVMNTSELQMLLLKCRSLICKHITTEDALGSIALDYPKIWTTTYEMLEEFANRQEDIETLTLTDDMRLNSHDWELVQV